MKAVEVVDVALEVMPRKVLVPLIVAAILVTKGSVVTWYVLEQADSIQEALQGAFEDMIANLLPDEPVTVQPPRPV